MEEHPDAAGVRGVVFGDFHGVVGQEIVQCEEADPGNGLGVCGRGGGVCVINGSAEDRSRDVTNVCRRCWKMKIRARMRE